MKAIIPGHYYELENFQGIGAAQLIRFTERNQVDGSVIPGTTNEEVIRVLIDRMNFLQSQFPCRENALAVTKLEEALHWLHHRTADRVSRGVEGQHRK